MCRQKVEPQAKWVLQFEGASDCSSCLETVEHQLLSEARLEALEVLQTELRLRTH